MKQTGITALQPVLLKSKTNSKVDSKSTRFFNIITQITTDKAQGSKLNLVSRTGATIPNAKVSGEQAKSTVTTALTRDTASTKRRQEPIKASSDQFAIGKYSTGINPKPVKEFHVLSSESSYVLNPADVHVRLSEKSSASAQKDNRVIVFPVKGGSKQSVESPNAVGQVEIISHVHAPASEVTRSDASNQSDSAANKPAQDHQSESRLEWGLSPQSEVVSASMKHTEPMWTAPAQDIRMNPLPNPKQNDSATRAEKDQTIARRPIVAEYVSSTINVPRQHIDRGSKHQEQSDIQSSRTKDQPIPQRPVMTENTTSSNDTPKQQIVSNGKPQEQTIESDQPILRRPVVNENTTSTNDTPKQQIVANGKSQEQTIESEQPILRRPVMTENTTSSNDAPKQQVVTNGKSQEQTIESEQPILRRPVVTENTTSTNDTPKQQVVSNSKPQEHPIESDQPILRRPVVTENSTSTNDTPKQQIVSNGKSQEQTIESEQPILRRPVVNENTTSTNDAPKQQIVTNGKPQEQTIENEQPTGNRNNAQEGAESRQTLSKQVAREDNEPPIESRQNPSPAARSEQPVSVVTTKTMQADQQRLDNPVAEHGITKNASQHDSSHLETSDQGKQNESPTRENSPAAKQQNNIQPEFHAVEQVAQQLTTNRVVSPQPTPMSQTFSNEFLQKAMQKLKEFETGTTATKNWAKFEMTHEETGRVQTVLESDNGKLQILLVAEDSEKMKYLQDTMKGLQEHFTRLGYEDVQVEYDYDRQHRRRNEQQPRNFAKQRTTTAAIEKPQAKPGRMSKRTGYNTIDYVA